MSKNLTRALQLAKLRLSKLPQLLLLLVWVASVTVAGLGSIQAYAQSETKKKEFPSFGSSKMPLMQEEAFKPSIKSVDAEKITVQFEIADEYYLYQKRMNQSSDSSTVTLSAPAYSETSILEDAYFGKSEVFRHDATIEIPLSALNNTATEFNLTLGYQGCADMGLCYPPMKTSFKVELPAKAPTAIANANASVSSPTGDQAGNQSSNNANIQANILAELKQPSSNASPISRDLFSSANTGTPSGENLNTLLGKDAAFGADEAPLLSPEQAFIPSIESAGNGKITMQWFIESGYFLYRDKIHFNLLDANNATIAQADIDRGKIKDDEFFGEVEILRDSPSTRITLQNAANLSAATLEIQYQGCADIGVCFPPEVRSIPVNFTNTDVVAMASMGGSGNGGSGGAVSGSSSSSISSAGINNLSANVVNTDAAVANSNVVGAAQTNSANAAVVLPETEQNRLMGLLKEGHLGVIAFAFYVAGILLAFTACMYPMIPILSSLIVGQGDNIGTGRAFTLSLVYVVSMASVFAVAGILVGLSGYNIQPLFQNPWVLSAFAALFVLLSLSMFGLYTLQMPNSIQSKVAEISNKQKSGSVSGVASMGMLSALIVGPCVTPPLVAALAYIANTGDARIGGIALFAIGIGMGTPLLFIGTSLGRFMPKAGGWMDNMQRFFGIVLLGVAIYMLSRFLPANVIMIMAAALAIFSGVYFGATDKLDQDSRGSQRVAKSLGLVAMVYGIVVLVGALSGGTSLLSPLKGIVGPQVAQNGGLEAPDAHLAFERVKSVEDLEVVLAAAKAQNRPVMLDFYADWCISCIEMEERTFPDQRVKAQLTDAILIQADVTKNDADDKAMLKEFSLFGPPGIILYDREGTELTAGRVVGFMKADKFSTHLEAYLN